MRFSIFAAASLLCGLCVAKPVEPRSGLGGPSSIKRFKYYNTKNKAGTICDSDQGPDGLTLWYQDLTASVVGYVNYKTGIVREFNIPWSHGSKRAVNTPQLNNVTTLQCVMRLGKDGNIYGGAGIRNEIIRINPRVHPPIIKTFSPKGHQTGNLQNFNDAWGANTGLWFSQTTANLVTFFDYKTHKFTNYKVKDAIPGVLNSPLGMRTDAYDNLWFTNFVGQYLSKHDKKTDKIVEYPNCCLDFLTPKGGLGLFPEVLRSATNNLKLLWANSFGNNGYIRMDVTNPDKPGFTFVHNPKVDAIGSFPFENVNDYCGRVWYTSPTMNNVYYYDTHSGKWTTIKVPASISGPPKTGSFEVTMHRGPGGYMWFTEGTVGRIVRYTIDPSCKGEPA